MSRVGLLLTCLILSGCTSSGSKTPDARPASRDKNRREPAEAPFWADPKNQDDVDNTTSRNNRIPPAGLPTRSDADSLIAGTVVDIDGRRVPDAFIQITNLKSPKTAKPIGIHTDAQGYFSVPVRPGQGYELSVRVEDQSRVLGASMIVQAPDTKIILRVTQDNVSSLTPTAPPPVGTGPFAQQGPRDLRSPASSSWRDTPVPDTQNKPKLPPINTSRPENVAADGFSGLPAANIPGPGANNPSIPSTTPPLPPLIDPGLPPTTSKPKTRATRLEFELADLQGNPWRFGEHSGKLVLLDFWGTWCGPCMQSIPKVRQVAKDYGASGLEVIGVACEREGTWNQQATKVAKVQQSKEINYGLYLEPEGKSGSVQDKFDIKSYPTLILLDREGAVLYRGHDSVQLEKIIKANLR